MRCKGDNFTQPQRERERESNGSHKGSGKQQNETTGSCDVSFEGWKPHHSADRGVM